LFCSKTLTCYSFLIMAPSLPIVAALLSVSHAHRAAELDEGASMLQMPVTEVSMAVDQEGDDCRCPGYVQLDCEAAAASGCVWSDAGDSNGAWCQCLNPPVDPAPVPPPAPAPAPVPPVATTTAEPVDPIPEGWTMSNENWNCAGSRASRSEHSATATNNEECARACYAEGHIIAAFWHNNRDICRCYDSCDGGGATVMPSYPNTVMQKEIILASTDMKCPHNNGDRLFRSPASGSNDISLAACHFECQNTEHCAHFSWGVHGGGNVCMGCSTLQNEQVHVGFNTYDMEHSTPPIQMINNWNFESMTVDGEPSSSLEEGKWIHFLNAGNSGLTNTEIPAWQQMGSGAGASGLYNSNVNEIAAEGSHVLFLNQGDDDNYVYQDLLEPFTSTLNIEAAVCGGNGGSDGGYRFGLYSEDGTLLQEEVAGVNGAPLCTVDGVNQYVVTHMSISAGDHPAYVGQTLQLRLMKNSNGQGHYHYIRFT